MDCGATALPRLTCGSSHGATALIGRMRRSNEVMLLGALLCVCTAMRGPHPKSTAEVLPSTRFLTLSPSTSTWSGLRSGSRPQPPQSKRMSRSTCEVARLAILFVDHGALLAQPVDVEKPGLSFLKCVRGLQHLPNILQHASKRLHLYIRTQQGHRAPTRLRAQRLEQKTT